MALSIMILVRVAGKELAIFSPVNGPLLWAKTQIVHGTWVREGDIKSNDDDWVSVGGLRDHEQAKEIASILIKDLLDDGWEYYNYPKYVDGQWFKKQLKE